MRREFYSLMDLSSSKRGDPMTKAFWTCVVILGTLGWATAIFAPEKYPGERQVMLYLPQERLDKAQRECAEAEKTGLNERVVIRDRMDEVVVLPCRWVKQQ
jgi:hypothetical protein